MVSCFPCRLKVQRLRGAGGMCLRGKDGEYALEKVTAPEGIARKRKVYAC